MIIREANRLGSLNFEISISGFIWNLVLGFWDFYEYEIYK